ncbi:MAG TPA: hypothetical protein VNB90_13180 [Cytophagaceae bacterium]|nr:hypothetical protein [Cytophagaceae bacterium]
MKKVLFFAAALAVLSLSSCKKDCTADGITVCTKCTKSQQDACKLYADCKCK